MNPHLLAVGILREAGVWLVETGDRGDLGWSSCFRPAGSHGQLVMGLPKLSEGFLVICLPRYLEAGNVQSGMHADI